MKFFTKIFISLCFITATVSTNAQTVTTVATGLASPFGLAIDASGNLYVANYSGGTISKITTGGTVSTFASGLNGPTFLVFDAAGNLYATNNIGNTISKITTGGTVSTFASGFNQPYGIAIDAAGDFYVANYGSGTISKITTGGTVSTFVSGLSLPVGLSFDASGNLYVTSYSSGTISKITTGGTVSTFASGFNKPSGLVFDPSGNMYEANYGGGSINKITTGGTVSAFVSSGLNGPTGLAISPNALYTANITSGTVSKVAIGSLPLQLISFSAQRQSSTVTLNWQSANETNTSHFNIQRSTDGVNFATIISTTNAIGNGNNNYSYSDDVSSIINHSSSIHYRLQSVDKDGSFTYSKVISIALGAKSSALNIYPNPIQGNSITVDAGSNITTSTPYTIYNVLGKAMLQGNITSRYAAIDITNLSSGTYVIQFNGQSVKLVKP